MRRRILPWVLGGLGVVALASIVDDHRESREAKMRSDEREKQMVLWNRCAENARRGHGVAWFDGCRDLEASRHVPAFMLNGVATWAIITKEDSNMITKYYQTMRYPEDYLRTVALAADSKYFEPYQYCWERHWQNADYFNGDGGKMVDADCRIGIHSLPDISEQKVVRQCIGEVCEDIAYEFRAPATEQEVDAAKTLLWSHSMRGVMTLTPSMFRVFGVLRR